MTDERPARADLARYSARPARPGQCADFEPKHVVVATVPEAEGSSRSPLERAFTVAKRLLDEGHDVRVVGEGVTHESTWPAWATREPKLLLTEVGAYARRDAPVLQRRLVRAIDAWVDDTFGDAFEGERASELLSASATSRVFGPLLEVSAFAPSLLDLHPGAVHHCGDPVLRALLGARGDDDGARKPRRWRSSLVAAIGAKAARATLGRARRFVRSAPMRAWVAEQPISARPPALWAALVTLWGERANRHVVDTVVKPALARGLPVGILLIIDIADVPPSPSDTSDLWRWLRELSPAERSLLRFAQAADAPSVVELGRVTAEMLRCSARIGRSLARSSPQISLAGLPFDLRGAVDGLANLLTTDVLTALVGLGAAGAAVTGTDATMAVFAVYSFVETTAPATAFRRDGITTVDFVHGSGGSLFPWDHDVPRHVFGVWSESDAQAITRLGGRPVVVGVPRVATPTAPRRGPPKRVLVMTNYLHVSWDRVAYPLLPHHRLLFTAVENLRAVLPPDCEIVWRPHPSEDKALVEASEREHPWLRRSRNAELDRDLAEADVVISTMSSAVFEALLWSRPLFLHVLPGYRWFPQMAAFAEERKFYHPDELVDSFARCVAQLAANDPRVLDPERQARAALLPSEGAPAPLDAFLSAARGD